jgi:hypothetical protein
MEFTVRDLAVFYKGKLVTVLNPLLVEKQKLNKEQVKELILTHEDRARIFEEMRNTDDVEDLKMYAEQFEALEYEQQRIWGFPQDRNFHRWFDVPKCRCPKMDNAENIGTKYRIIAGHCPIHNIDEENKNSGTVR